MLVLLLSQNKWLKIYDVYYQIMENDSGMFVLIQKGVFTFSTNEQKNEQCTKYSITLRSIKLININIYKIVIPVQYKIVFINVINIATYYCYKY